MAVLFSLLVLAGLVVGIFFGGQQLLNLIDPSSQDFTGQGSGEIEIRVREGDTLSDIARTLVDAGVIASIGPFIDAAEAHPDATGIQPGVYSLRQEMSGQAALDLMLDPVARLVSRVTVPEGLTADATLVRLSESTGIPVAEFEAAAADPAALGLPAWTNGSVEGFLFPATYDFEPDTPAADILHTMVARAMQAFTDLQIPAESLQEVLTEASLVQAEAATAEDMAKVARVIENRIAIQMPLQFDTTVNYANGKSGITTTAGGSGQPLAVQHVPARRAAAGADQQPRRAGAAGGARTGRRRLAVLRGRRPRHRRDPLRGHRRGARRRTSCSSSSGCGRTPRDENPGMRAAVLGRPVSHSLSPLLHRAAYAALGLDDWTYDALDVGAEDLRDLLAGLGEEWRGFSVTMPCKQAAVDVADVVEPLPRLLHAANTLVRTDAGWRAENTDVTGVGMALQLSGVERVTHAAILGAGGTAAAAAVALSSLGAQHVDVVVRNPERAADLLRIFRVLGRVDGGDDARRTRPRRAPGREHRPDRRPARSARPAVAGRPDRARRAVRAVADAAGAAGPGRLRHRRRRPRGAVLAGDRPGRAVHRSARADRRDAGGARRRRRPALSRPWRCPGRCCSALPWCSPSRWGRGSPSSPPG